MLDVKAGRIIKPAGVLIQGDRIVEVIPTVKHPKGAEVIDLRSVLSEPFSAKFPVTRKNKGKFKRFPPEQLPLNPLKMPFQSHPSVPPPPVDGKQNRELNRHNSDLILQIKNHAVGQIREDQYKASTRI
jgi:hypothetical protein